MRTMQCRSLLVSMISQSSTADSLDPPGGLLKGKVEMQQVEGQQVEVHQVEVHQVEVHRVEVHQFEVQQVER